MSRFPNLMPNPDCEVDVVGWNGANGGETIARDGTQAFSGSYSCEVTTQAVAGSGMWWANRDGSKIAATAGLTYRMSVWVYGTGSAIGKTFYPSFNWWTGGGSFISNSQGPAVTLASGWQRITYAALAPATTASMQPLFTTTANLGVFSFWADDAWVFADPGCTAETGAFVHVIELDFASGALYLTTAPLPVVATVPYPSGSTASHTFSAIGGELTFDEVAEGVEIGSQQAVLRLAAVDQTVIAAVLNSACVGLQAYVWRCYLSSSWAVQAVTPLFAGFLNDNWLCDDHRPEDPAEAPTATIETRVVDLFSDFDQVRGIQTSLASHQSVAEQTPVAAGATAEHLFANDLGMRYVAVMPSKRFQWGDIQFVIDPTLPYQQRGGGATSGYRR